MTTETKRERTYRFYRSLERLGIDVETADKLRRIEMTLSRWSELECGDSNSYCSTVIERDEETDKPYRVIHYHSENKPRRYAVADREKGALKRLAAIMVNYPDLTYYHQTDPRGCALYIVRKADIPTDWFDVVAVNGHFTIQRRGSNSPYNCTIATEPEAREFADRETLNSFYTRGVAVCID